MYATYMSYFSLRCNKVCLFFYLMQCTLQTVPRLDQFSSQLKLGLDDGNVTQINAALAIQLANSFLLQKRTDVLEPYTDFYAENGMSTKLLPFHYKGLESTNWKGRFQV
jgi:hypothetical protein